MTRPTWLDCDHAGIGLPGCPTCDGREDWHAWRCVASAARDYIRELEARVQPAAPPAFDDLTFARQVAPGLEWQDGVAYAWAELPTGRAVSADGYASISRWSIIVAVGGYKLRRDLARPLTVAEARHVLHGFAQRLARSKLDYRRAAGLAILTGMEER